jgi:hypothetical protein
MMSAMTYEVLAERWHDFSIVAGTAAATLVGFSALGYVGAIIAGALLGGGADGAALDWLWVVMVVLLFVSLRNSWDLLVSVGEATLTGQGGELD